MKTIDLPSKKKMLIISISLVVISSILMISCYMYHRYRTYESIKVVVKNKASVEYGSANYSIDNLIEKVEGEIVSVKQDIDTKKIGEQEVVVEVMKENMIKEIMFKVNVIDTTAPTINIKEEKITLTEGDNYDFVGNIDSIKDEVDGDITYQSDAGEDSKLFYNFAFGEDINSVGEHEVSIIAKDNSGNTSVKKFIIEVKEKPVVVSTPSVINTPETNASAPANGVGGDLVSIAYSLVGSPYISGSNGPYGFDCSGFVQYVYSRVGKSVSRSSYTQAYDGVGVSYENAQPGDILNWGHGGEITHSALYVGDGLMIHATNPSQGVVVSSVSGWQNGSIDNLIGVRRVQ